MKSPMKSKCDLNVRYELMNQILNMLMDYSEILYRKKIIIF